MLSDELLLSHDVVYVLNYILVTIF
jgi:hypothetical protein